jgi:hypothetical protein
VKTLVICALLACALASVALADPSQRSLPNVSTKDLDDYINKTETDPYYLMGLLDKNRNLAEALVRAGQKQRPAEYRWPLDVLMLFATDVSKGKSLQGKERVAHYKYVLEYLQESYDASVAALKKEPNVHLQEVLPCLQLNLALAALEAGDTELAKKHATETLNKNADPKKTDPKNLNYGNIIHDANQTLGRVALRDGKLADAKSYLLKSGATPGSAQLNTFGPQMPLARELLEKGEKETVLQYLDLVSNFWATDFEETEQTKEHAATIAGWKREINDGKIPTGAQWR